MERTWPQLDLQVRGTNKTGMVKYGLGGSGLPLRAKSIVLKEKCLTLPPIVIPF